MFFKFTTAGESHGKALITIVEGLPAGMPVDKAAIDHELWRRQQGYGRGGRMKIESDKVEFLSGVRHGRTIGSPITMMIENRDFVHWQDVMSAEPPANASVDEPIVKENDGAPKVRRVVTRPRPGHADLAGGQKFAARDLRDILERASARETAARVAAGALAKQLLAQFGVDVRSHVIKLGSIPEAPLDKTWEEIAAIEKDAPLACADRAIEAEMVALVDTAKANGDTIGGIFEVVAKGVIPGLGSHTSWYEKLDGRIAQAFMSIQAVKAVEVGTAVANSGRFGSEVHDEIFWSEPGAIATGFLRSTNRAGGLEGGITNGEELRVRGYLKPISTLRKALHSVDIETKQEDLAAFERSDITAVPAAGVIGESMLAIVLANSMREKFGGDSLEEMRNNFNAYLGSLEAY
ncbi:MAG: chorismate synthase [bacterium]|nr:chorismate synthase [bacterium]